MLWSLVVGCCQCPVATAVAVSAFMHACSLIWYVHASSRPQRHSAHDCGMHVTCQAHCCLPVRCQPFLARSRALSCYSVFRPTSPVVTKVCEVLRSACLSVCLFICTLAYVKYHASKFHQIFYTCYLCRGSVLLWRQCPLLWMTPGFHIIQQLGQYQRRRFVQFARERNWYRNWRCLGYNTNSVQSRPNLAKVCILSNVPLHAGIAGSRPP